MFYFVHFFFNEYEYVISDFIREKKIKHNLNAKQYKKYGWRCFVFTWNRSKLSEIAKPITQLYSSKYVLTKSGSVRAASKCTVYDSMTFLKAMRGKLGVCNYSKNKKKAKRRSRLRLAYPFPAGNWPALALGQNNAERVLTTRHGAVCPNERTVHAPRPTPNYQNWHNQHARENI